MRYRIDVYPGILHFKRPAGTSRGVYTERKSWFISLSSPEQPGRRGIGECAPLPRLSCDDRPDYEERLAEACRNFSETGRIDFEGLRDCPSILFGLETALRHFEAGSFQLWDTPFSRGEAGIPINGLVWMGSYEEMLRQVEEKIKAGFRCIKLKIGAIAFEKELSILRSIRRRFSPEEIELRVDANGAFSPDEAMGKLERLAEMGLHSIEQPIRAGQWEEMARIAAASPVPVALDEELIGCNTPEAKRELLSFIRPQYIILKPSLHGGLQGCNEWIREAESRQIGWWATSALESNIGLNAIAQWCATLGNPLPQGLGTGGLFTDNFDLPLSVSNGQLKTNHCPLSIVHCQLSRFLSEWRSDAPLLEVQTSGSTGTPKRIRVRKEQMVNSARMTCDFLGLRKGDKALLCLPLQYIAGKMMVVRSLVAGLDLVVREPSGHPMADVDLPLRLAAMVPLQVYNTLQVPEERRRLCRTDILLIGGGAVDRDLEKQIKELPVCAYSTYGMTETLSHIALRRLNGREASPYYTPLPSVRLSLSADGTLVIKAPLVADGPVVTNDIAELLPDGRFRILGRKDNIIDSGGIKIQIEAVEEVLRDVISTNFAITSVADPKFGEAVVLLIAAGDERFPDEGAEALLDGRGAFLFERLPRYQRPKHIVRVEAIPLTGNGKIDRAACRRLAMEGCAGAPDPHIG